MNTCNGNRSFQSINATSKQSWLLLKQNGWLRCILGLRSTFILSFIFVLTIHSNEWKATSMNGRLSHFWIGLSAVSKSFDLDSNLQLWSNPGVTLARFYCDRNTRNAFSRLFSELFRIIPELTGSILKFFAFFPGDPQALLRAIILDAEAPQAQGLGDELLVYVAKYVPEALSTVLRNALDLLMMVLKTCSIHFERLVLDFWVV